MSQTELHRLVNQVYSGSALSSGSSTSSVYVVDNFASVSYIVDLTAAGGSPSSYSLVTKLQYSPETSGSRWYDLPNSTLTLTSVTTANIVNIPLLTARRVRLAYTASFVGGTSPTVTISADLSVGNTSPSGNVTVTGEAVSVSDGADVAIGATTDAAATAGGTGTVSAKLRKMSADIGTLLTQTDGVEASLTAIDTNAGITTDAAVTTDANGTISAKLRGLVKIFNDVWDSTNHFLKITNGTLQWGEDGTNQTQGVTQKPVTSATYSSTFGKALANDVDISLKASAGHLDWIYATNANAAIRYLQVFNKASAPAGSDVPEISLPMAATTGFATLGANELGLNGQYFGTGVAIGISTTQDTFTAATTTDHRTFYRYH